MKKRIILIVLLIICSVKIIAQERSCESCRTFYNGSDNERKIGYNFCDPINNRIVSICTEGNPYNMKQPYTNWKPMKICLPLEYGNTLTYDNTDVPWSNLGPWREQVWEGQYKNDFKFHDSDIPNLISAAMAYWQNICSPYNNSDCQPCNIKIMWTKDASKLGNDKLLPSHAYNPLSSGCSYDCSKLAIILNGTSGFSSVNTQGKPLKYFITRGGGPPSWYGRYLVNTDLRTEIMHQLGYLLGFTNTPPDGDPGYCCDQISGVAREDEFLNNTFEIKPNPISSQMNIKIVLHSSQIIDIGIYDLLGNRVASIINDKYLNQNVYNFDVELNNLSNGTYFCIYREGDRLHSKLFVIMR